MAVLLLAAAASGCAAKRGFLKFENYLVQPGDNLWRISEKYHVRPTEIARANGLEQAEGIYPGQRLKIPLDTQARRKDEGAARKKPIPGKRLASLSAGSIRSAPPPERPEDSEGRLAWPAKGVLYTKFGPRGDRHHDGLDIAAPQGTPIAAAADGLVLYADNKQRAYGNLVIIEHDPDLVTVYAHNEVNLVKAGQRVKAGQIIGKVGRTGRATGPHLHFEVRRNTKPVDPLKYLP